MIRKLFDLKIKAVVALLLLEHIAELLLLIHVVELLVLLLAHHTEVSHLSCECYMIVKQNGALNKQKKQQELHTLKSTYMTI